MKFKIRTAKVFSRDMEGKTTTPPSSYPCILVFHVPILETLSFWYVLFGVSLKLTSEWFGCQSRDHSLWNVKEREEIMTGNNSPQSYNWDQLQGIARKVWSCLVGYESIDRGHNVNCFSKWLAKSLFTFVVAATLCQNFLATKFNSTSPRSLHFYAWPKYCNTKWVCERFRVKTDASRCVGNTFTSHHLSATHGNYLIAFEYKRLFVGGISEGINNHNTHIKRKIFHFICTHINVNNIHWPEPWEDVHQKTLGLGPSSESTWL